MTGWQYEPQDVLPARVIGPAAADRVALILCPDVEKWGGGQPLDILAVLLTPDCQEAGTLLLVGWDGPREEGRVAWAIPLPRFSLTVYLPGPFVDADYVPITGRFIPAINAAMRQHGLGPQVENWIAGPGSDDFFWDCAVWTHDVRRAVTVLRGVLTSLAAQPDARIDVDSSDVPIRVVRSYPLIPRNETEDWADLTEVQNASRLSPELAVAMFVPCE